MKWLLLFFFLLAPACWFVVSAQKTISIYVSASGSDRNTGSINRPLRTLQQAKLLVRKYRRIADLDKIRIILRKGVYYINEPIRLEAEDGGNAKLKVEYSAAAGEKVYINGGTILPNKWVNVNGNVWKIKTSAREADKWQIVSLFCNGVRLNCAMSDTLYSRGPFPEFKGRYKPYDFKAVKELIKDSLYAFCGFVYSKRDLNSIKDTYNCRVIVYNSWEASWHDITKLDTLDKRIFFANPTCFPVGFYSDTVRYQIYNSKSFFNNPGQWYFDITNKELWYRAFAGQNPNKCTFTIPNLEQLLTIDGAKNIEFIGLTFSYSSSAWGKNELLSGTEISPEQSAYRLDFSKGFSGIQNSIACGEAVLVKNSQNCIFKNCFFKKNDGYGIRIGENASHNSIISCSFSDLGAGGIVIGFDNMSNTLGFVGGSKQVRVFANQVDLLRKRGIVHAPEFNQVINCNISNCGIIHPGSVGIALMHANTSYIKANLICELPYTGISVGWWAPYPGADSANRIELNEVYNVMKVLADGGGIYAIGKQYGASYKLNYLHNIFRARNAIGSKNNGFFFDEGAQGINVDSNVVRAIQNEDIRFNGTTYSRVNIGSHNYFEKSSRDINLQKKLLQIFRQRKLAPVN